MIVILSNIAPLLCLHLGVAEGLACPSYAKSYVDGSMTANMVSHVGWVKREGSDKESQASCLVGREVEGEGSRTGQGRGVRDSHKPAALWVNRSRERCQRESQASCRVRRLGIQRHGKANLKTAC